jgi:hypothetical protein
LDVIVSTAHHELNHYFLSISKKKIETITEWFEINVRAKKELSREDYKRTFADPYGMKSVWEDMATWGERFFAEALQEHTTSEYFIDNDVVFEGTNFEDFQNDFDEASLENKNKIRPTKAENMAKVNQFIKQKRELLKRMYFEASNGYMNEEYWQNLINLPKIKP